MINAPMTCRTLNNLHKSLMIGIETSRPIQMVMCSNTPLLDRFCRILGLELHKFVMVSHPMNDKAFWPWASKSLIDGLEKNYRIAHFIALHTPQVWHPCQHSNIDCLKLGEYLCTRFWPIIFSLEKYYGSFTTSVVVLFLRILFSVGMYYSYERGGCTLFNPISPIENEYFLLPMVGTEKNLPHKGWNSTVCAFKLLAVFNIYFVQKELKNLSLHCNFKIKIPNEVSIVN